MTRDRTRTMVLRKSRSIQKHVIGTGCELSYCDMRAAGCALCVIALRSHLTNLFLRVTVWRHVVWRSDATWDILTPRFTSRPPAIRHIHVNIYNERKKAMKVSSHVQEHRRDLVLPRHSQQRFRLRTEAGSFRNMCLFWIFVAMENALISAGDISQRKTGFIFVL